MLRTFDLVLAAHRFQHGIKENVLGSRIHAQQSFDAEAKHARIVGRGFQSHLGAQKPWLKEIDGRLDGLEQICLVFGRPQIQAGDVRQPVVVKGMFQLLKRRWGFFDGPPGIEQPFQVAPDPWPSMDARIELSERGGSELALRLGDP